MLPVVEYLKPTTMVPPPPHMLSDNKNKLVLHNASAAKGRGPKLLEVWSA